MEITAAVAREGHEGSGIVERTGSAVTKVKAGDRVAISFRSCGECRKCKAGKPAYCLTMPMLNYIGMRPDGSKAIHKGGEDLSSCRTASWRLRQGRAADGRLSGSVGRSVKGRACCLGWKFLFCPDDATDHCRDA